jgi:hypothetical protein
MVLGVKIIEEATITSIGYTMALVLAYVGRTIHFIHLGG